MPALQASTPVYKLDVSSYKVVVIIEGAGI
jgi:hypothetical protein